MTKNEVVEKVKTQLLAGGPAKAQTFKFADGSQTREVPVGIELLLAGRKKGLQIALYNESTKTRRTVLAKEIVGIQD